MTVSSIQLLFENGETSATFRPGKDVGAVTALRSMIAESYDRYGYRVRFRMADGSMVIAKPRAER